MYRRLPDPATMMFRAFLFLTFLFEPSFCAHESIKFDPFLQSEEYKCTQFLRDAMEDKAMEQYYSFNNLVIEVLSKPFPHRELISQRMLQGDLDAWKESFTVQYYKWLEYGQWWMIFGGSFVAVCLLFSVGYVLYRFCICCCRSRAKETTDREYDRCKRNFLNVVLSILAIANVFAGTALFISTQYMEYGVGELPRRVNNCIDDLNLYKRNTDEQVRKLLITDYQKLNHSLLTTFGKSGELIVGRIKEITGAGAVDQLLLAAKNASENS
uniref:Protein tweety homolog n=1 Tax=Steinernema glaseri TaxID=37863 RepID=A0A1I7ZEU6_9BILA